MYKNNSYYETVYNNILDPILLMEGQFFIDANSSALTLFALNSKEDLLLMHPSQLSPEFQPDGELSSIKANKMIKICNNRGQHIFEWLAKSFDEFF
ncbi:MAG: PAS domain-containing protein [Aliarcobacter sp.]|nr:PAS domain-containing protein [Aliarcobacter sp.]